ncbi:MAG: hypothetical protein KF916_06360 [Microbacteriaceae bacterium]|nr:hypothetical protein [Microbacteriaceae bacterium]
MGEISTLSYRKSGDSNHPDEGYMNLWWKLHHLAMDYLLTTPDLESTFDLKIREALQEEPVKSMLHSFLEEAKHDFGYEPPAHEKQTLDL